MHVESRSILVGCSGGLAERTALFDVALVGDTARLDVVAAEARIRTEVAMLWPEEPLFGVTEGDWPAAFLLGAVDGDGRDEVAHWLGGWIIAVTVALQRWACDPVWRGRVLDAQPDRLRLAIPWFREAPLIDGLDLALRLITQCCQPEPDPAALADLRRWFREGLRTAQQGGLDPNSLRFIGAAVDRDIPFVIQPSYVQLGWGAAAIRLDSSCTGDTPFIARLTAGNGADASRTLAEAAVPVPSGAVVGNVEDAYRLAERLGWPVVVRPLERSPGVPVEPGITDQPHLQRALETALVNGPGVVIVESHVPGVDHRLLVVAGRLLAATQRNPGGEGAAVDVTESVHPDNRRLAIRAARILGLDVAGVDFITGDITRSWRDVGGAIRKVSPQPSFEVHWLADPRRDLNGEVLDVLFDARPTRIPTAAVTGTNGKTTTSTMLHRIWLAAGKCAGFSGTTGVRIAENVVTTENLSGQPGGRILLTDPAVEAAVLEMPRKGLFLFGHPCDRYDVAALLNVQDDHIGVDGIETLEQMAELKAEILQRARDAIVVNADDPLCLAMRARAGTDRHILVSREPTNAAVVEHRRTGGEAVFLTDIDGTPWIALCAGERQTPLMAVHDIPATRHGLLRFNQINAMFAAALAWAADIDTETIARALSAFDNTVEQAPGRYNFIDDLPFQLLVDFAHNPDGVREICRIVTQLPVTGRRILCTLNLGNEHPAHFESMAPLLAATFDEFVLGRDYQGPDPVEVFLSTNRQFLLDEGVQATAIECVADPEESRRRALSMARPGDLLVILGRTKSTLPVVDDYRTRMPTGRI